jgi:hypothetical protein
MLIGRLFSYPPIDGLKLTFVEHISSTLRAHVNAAGNHSVSFGNDMGFRLVSPVQPVNLDYSYGSKKIF